MLMIESEMVCCISSPRFLISTVDISGSFLKQSNTNRVLLKRSAVEAFNADCFDLVETAMGVEDEFGISVPSDDMAHFTTVADLVSYIESRNSEGQL